MKFLLTALLLVGAFSLRAARASGDDRKKVAHTLEGELKAQTVVLRNYYRGDRLEYDSNGQLKEGGPPGTWTLDGHVRVSKVQMGRDTLEIDGNREFMAFDLKTKAWAALPDQEVTILIGTPDGEADIAAERKLLLKVFLSRDEETPCLIPSYWPRMYGRVGCVSTNTEGQPSPGEGENASTNGKAIIIPPVAQENPEPPYTPEARRERISGELTLQVVVSPQGTVVDVLEKGPGLGDGLDQSAIRTVRNWTFKPATRNGAPIQISAIVYITFRLFSYHR